MHELLWLDEIVAANQTFVTGIDPARLPIARTPGQAIITCMDPRVNLAALGIAPFDLDGAGPSSVRIIRALGAIADERSLLVGIFLAGIREIVVMTHTDCGCCLAYSKIDVIEHNMLNRLPTADFDTFQSQIGEPFQQKLRRHLRAFQDPREAVLREIARIRNLSFVPDDIVLHGLTYTLETGGVEVIVNGYPT